MKISKNFERGKLVKNSNQLVELAHTAQAVYWKKKSRIIPAAFFLSMQFSLVCQMINNKELYYIIKLK